MNIYVGNLAKDVTDDDLQGLFSTYGNVTRAKVIKDMFSGESKGFGFVEMPGATEAQKAINELNTHDLKGKKLVVNEARPKTDSKRPGGGGGGRSSGGGGRSSGGGGGRGNFGGGGGGNRW
ncbi:MAG: RNA-binding protein [Ignavibacteriales bacterium]|nr:RNA-binding protein [Ignavibacteriales bacterium]